MLPAAAMYYFPWEIKCGALHDGQSVRTFGRLTYYDPEKSQASLTVQHASEDHQVVINTSFVEPFNPIIGAQYVVLGDIQTGEGVDIRVCARVLNCVDGVNIALLQKAINEQRSFFRERQRQVEGAAV
ncbi:CST complex subunit TEN1 isoform X1 [Syngnathoides biaculeatus]|uniref:CST complex subunit TEN1 isoform X1 n=1 Tax=Syngnathoides biaculeatus TaxID=300417 RepID=UPI002ADD4CEB|nr:CST complex subunit TEN1 isoform X1 [Syngnathoides biaculeatus]